jgi:hypothetical protein
MERRGQRCRDVLGLQRRRDVVLDHDVLHDVLHLHREGTPHVVVGREVPRVACLQTELLVLVDLHPAVAKRHLQDRAVIDAGIAGLVGLAVGQARLRAPRHGVIQGFPLHDPVAHEPGHLELVVDQFG